MAWEYLGLIPGFSREVDDNWGFISYYAASNGNLLQTFPYSLSVPQFLDCWPFEDGTDRLSRNVGKKLPLLAA